MAEKKSLAFVLNMAAPGRGRGQSQPETEIKTKTKTETVTKTKQVQRVESKRKRKKKDEFKREENDDFEEAKLFKVILIGDEEYDEGHVIERLMEIVEDMDEDKAAKLVDVAQSIGNSEIGKYPLELAEVYKEKLLRSDPIIYSDLEDEDS